MKGKKITLEMATKKLKELGFELLSAYQNKRSLITVKCPRGHVTSTACYESITSPRALASKYKNCNTCAREGIHAGLHLSEEEVQKRYKIKNLKVVGKYKDSLTDVLTQCFCGEVFESKPDSIFQGKTRSCGCLKRSKNSANFKGFGNIPKTYISAAIRNAETRQIPHPLLKVGRDGLVYLDQILVKQNFKCALSGEPIHLDPNKNPTASLDRIDSSKGYVRGNVQWVHKKVNIMKWDLSNAEFKDWCKKITFND